LPINGELWLTTDMKFWGRFDPDTLESYPDKITTTALTLNAHPACDTTGDGTCYVFLPCGDDFNSGDACISQLTSQTGGLQTVRLGTGQKLPQNITLMHSHSPGVTTSQVIVKVDRFVEREARDMHATGAGILKSKMQAEENYWVTLDRQTHTTRLLTADQGFVNNHFWNPYDDGEYSVVDVDPATKDYLDNYYRDSLSQPVQWDKILLPPKRCHVPLLTNPDQHVKCKDLLVDQSVIIDYPTFNPHIKTYKYQYFYAITPRDKATSKW